MPQGRKKPPVERRATKRVVLERRRVVTLPDEAVRIDAVMAAAHADDGEALQELGVELHDAWLERGVYEGERQAVAIEQYAGKPGTPDARVGTFRAPTLSSWKGGVRYVAPPAPLVQRELL